MSRYESRPEGTTTTRIERPDGSTPEVQRAADGRITIGQFGSDGDLVETFVAELSKTGAVAVRCIRGGVQLELEPHQTKRQSNAFGATLEQAAYEGGLGVEQTFDDDATLRSTTVRADWGTQTLEIRPDGASTLEWSTTGDH